MVKYHKLSDLEKFYIEKNPEKLPLDELATKLNRTEGQLVKHLDEFKASQQNPKGSVANQLMGHHKRKGKTVSTVMTPAASEYSDATRKTRMPSKLTDAIHKPFSDD